MTEIYTTTIDDDPMIGLLIEKYTGFANRNFTSVAAILREIDVLDPVVAFLDVSLSLDESGLDLIPTLNQKLPNAPIIVISSSDDDQTIETALKLGAKDFIRKPIRAGELKARMERRLDEHKMRSTRLMSLARNLDLDVEGSKIVCGSQSSKVAKTGAKILAHLRKNAGQPVTRETLKRIGWEGVHVAEGSLDRQIYELRSLLKSLDAECQIVAHYGEGYRWDEKK